MFLLANLCHILNEIDELYKGKKLLFYDKFFGHKVDGFPSLREPVFDWHPYFNPIKAVTVSSNF